MPSAATARATSAEGAVPAEELVASGADQGDLESGVAHRPRHVIAVEAVEGRLIEAVERRIELGDESAFGQHDLSMPRADRSGDAPGNRPLVVLLLFECERESVNVPFGCFLRQVRHRRRIHPAGQEHPERNVAREVQTDALLDLAFQAGDAP